MINQSTAKSVVFLVFDEIDRNNDVWTAELMIYSHIVMVASVLTENDHYMLPEFFPTNFLRPF